MLANNFRVVYRVFGLASTSSDAGDLLARTELGSVTARPSRPVPPACNYSRHTIPHAHALTNTNKPLPADKHMPELRPQRTSDHITTLAPTPLLLYFLSLMRLVLYDCTVHASSPYHLFRFRTDGLNNKRPLFSLNGLLLVCC